ncbi:putative SMC2-chromosome segregation protein [Ceraceosorus guamensis]|uniref:Putative SMC2-chromosome segregation protein n=1 Tax=Ceraceosorus guamensis TaxID=1522189 RepID=A0A316VQG3_9BASI|nr:putative SMC2-chromosome segregation protein [Ceraceosorus guamensis]PWN38663.1 putative SMC2-chromosome segregation protein [Ceraceosorus guamensis]
MRIKEVTIDGFKSYPVRTNIKDFDPSFNAITGLNGSGKSNILDAICFVLGITNLSAVRATNLQDLIYKRGQAGVTRASVSINFDNTNRSQSPVAFENANEIVVTRQIAMGGLSKYMINGQKATQQAVQNMFQSVQLNINNPNFLIMQGKITKVLNMKPQEILSMMEEAAGTRMFEDRKEKAIKTITKKEQKVKEITSILTEEITPKLDKLREEKRSFLEYQRATSELERLTRLAKAHEWQSLRARCEEKTSALSERRRQVEVQQANVDALRKHIAGIEKELEGIEMRRENELTKGGKMQALVERSKAMAHQLVKDRTQLDFKVASVDEEAKSVAQNRDSLDALRKSHAEKAGALESVSGSFATLKATFDEEVAALERQDELLQTLLTGMGSKASDGAKQGGYMGQLADAREQEAALGTEIEQAKLRIGHLEKECKSKEPLAKKAEKEGASLIEELETARSTAAKLSDKLAALGWDEEKEQSRANSKSTLTSRLSALYEQRDRLKSRLAGTDFSYADPEPNFDRNRVKGLVASLVDLDENKHKYSTALEVCAGGRLYNVVVEDEKVGSQLLAKGQLKKRVTLIPLNKISNTIAASQRIGAAQKLSPGKVELALHLIGYEEQVSAAMAYVFGNTLICEDADTAKRVTFDDAVKMKSVTLDGDVYDPAGTLSGGSKPQSGGLLVKMQELNAVDRELKDVKRELARIDGEKKAAQDQLASYSRLKRELDLQQHAVQLLEGRMQNSNATRIITEVDALKKGIAGLRQSIEAAKTKQQTASAEAKRLEKEMGEFERNKDSKLDQLKADIKKRRASVQKNGTDVKVRQSEVRTLELELEQAALEVQNAEKSLDEASAQLQRSKSELSGMQAALRDLQTEADSLEAKVAAEKSMLTGYDEELDSLREAAKVKRQQIADSELDDKRLKHEIEKLTGECAGLEKTIKQLEVQFEWILDEADHFGKAGTAYDFGKHNMNEVKRTCKKLEEQQSGMKKRVNPKVLNMIDSVEKKETELKTMMSTVQKDQSKIEETIAELDRYKRDALQTTWEKVNGDFGEIFNELLPGNYAKLQPPEGMDITQGLEVKVRLGQVWKQSLTELSGGQR